jgi:hypothetical protein
MKLGRRQVSLNLIRGAIDARLAREGISWLTISHGAAPAGVGRPSCRLSQRDPRPAGGARCGDWMTPPPSPPGPQPPGRHDEGGWALLTGYLRADDGRLRAIVAGTGEIVAEHTLVAPGEVSVRDEHYGGPRSGDLGLATHGDFLTAMDWGAALPEVARCGYFLRPAAEER